MSLLLQLAGLFGKLSLLAVGGVNSTLPQIARDVVTDHHWLTAAQFSQLFAIANATPGPNLTIATMIGEHMAGVTGGLVATLAIILPAGLLVLVVSKVWDRYRENRWRRIIQAALLPITAGLVLAAAGILIRQADTGVLTALITLVTGGLTWRSRLHPLWLLGGGTLLGLLFV
ncbi:chromate transporter [Acidocella sp.]|jgi:chromate transporter|uniref:chromate transporter n=1 Tax=Acidocella sp. TaxID=50710 RepID=UPI002F401F1F